MKLKKVSVILYFISHHIRHEKVASSIISKIARLVYHSEFIPDHAIHLDVPFEITTHGHGHGWSNEEIDYLIQLVKPSHPNRRILTKFMFIDYDVFFAPDQPLLILMNMLSYEYKTCVCIQYRVARIRAILNGTTI